MKSIFVFRRDLRLVDNSGLNFALSQGEVLPVFIFDPRQRNHKYFSWKAFNFLIDSLGSLDEELRKQGSRLNIYFGSPEKVVESLSKKYQAVFVNRDYTPFSIERDKKIKAACKDAGLKFYSFNDSMLNSPESVFKEDKTSYQVFTSYYKKALQLTVSKPTTVNGEFLIDEKSESVSKLNFELIEKSKMKGGRGEGLRVLQSLKEFKDYNERRDYPSINTSLLSAYLKFGVVSIREVYHELRVLFGENHGLVRQLYFRDFFTYVAFHNPHVFTGAFDKKYDFIKWDDDPEMILAWKSGKTGFPIVDAGMRELNDTGLMHNRVRMITASFLTKDLGVSWRIGEEYFATKLVDYDPCINNSNWQWAAGTGCDAAPYFRIFNPWRQQEKFDKNCEYIKKWVPELKGLAPKQIHNLHKEKPLGVDYPSPIVDHGNARNTALKRYSSL